MIYLGPGALLGNNVKPASVGVQSLEHGRVGGIGARWGGMLKLREAVLPE